MKTLFYTLIIGMFLLSCGTENNPTFTLTTTVSPSEGGTISPPSGEFPKDEVVTLTGTPTSDGWRFVRWEGDWNVSSNPTSITMDKNYTIIGVFERKNYPLNITIIGEGTVEERVIQQKSTEYPYETVVELTPVPSNGWKFQSWGGDLSGSEVPIQISVSSEKNVTVRFERRDYPLTITVVGEGTVTETIIPQKTTEYPYETVVQLTPVPSEGWMFTGWGGDLTGNEVPTQIVVDTDKQVTVTFQLKTYPLNVSVVGNGTVGVEPQLDVYPHGSQVTLTPTPSEGWEFMSWGGDITESTVPLVVTVTSELSVVGTFQRKNYPLTITVVGEGTVTETIIPQKTTEYPYETVVQLTPVPSEGWEFVSWGGDLTGNEVPHLITVDTDKQVTVTFQLKTYPLNVSVVGNGTVGVEPQLDVYPHGTEVTLTPTPSDGWEFMSWSGDITETSVPLVVTVTSELNLVGTFQRKNYPLTITVVGEGTVTETIIPQKITEYPFETIVQLTPIPSEGWEFVSWGGDLSGNENPQMIVVDGDKSVTVTFQLKTYPLSVSVVGNGTVEVEPQLDVYPHGTEVTLTPTPSDGWEFMSWGGDITETSVPLVITVTSELNVIGTFQRKNYPLTITVVGEGTVTETIIPQKITEYPFETIVQLTPIPSEGWEFVSWGGDLSGNEVPTQIVVDTEKEVTVTFQLKTYPLSVSVVGNGTVGVEPQLDVYPHGTEVTLTPIPEIGWKLESWSGDVSGTTNPLVITVTSELNISLTLIPIVYLSDNGITIMCPNGNVGEIGVVDGVEYEVVNRNLLIQRRDEGEDLSKVCVSRITDMSSLFWGSSFNQPINNWDVSNVTDMSGMFEGSEFNHPIGNWDVSNVTDMNRMFLVTRFNHPIGNWNVSKVTNMREMFSNSTSFNQPLNNWDISSVTDMSSMFGNTPFNQPLNNWKVSNVTNMMGMFGSSQFNHPIENWNVSNVTNMRGMFSHSTFNQPIDKWDVSKVSTMNEMFSNSPFNQPLNSWNVSNSFDMSGMFSNTPFNQPINKWCVTNITSEPPNFSTNSPLTEENKPIWGTCPTP
jgi:surface protein